SPSEEAAKRTARAKSRSQDEDGGRGRQRRGRGDLRGHGGDVFEVHVGPVEQDGDAGPFGALGAPRGEAEGRGRELRVGPGRGRRRHETKPARARPCEGRRRERDERPLRRHVAGGGGCFARSGTISTLTTRVSSASRTMSFNPPTCTVAPTWG